MKLNFFRIIIVFILILFSLFYIIHRSLTPVFFSLAEVEAKNIANKIIHEVVEEHSEQMSYQDMIEYIYNDQGDVVLMQPNLKYINNFNSQVSLGIQRRLESISRETIQVPVTRILGIDILAAYGPDLSMRMVPAGFTEPPTIVDSFTSAGINQTRHKIYINLGVQIRLIVPFSSREVEVYADVPVTEVIIVGRVPQIYIDRNNNDVSGVFE
ncbi:sporulation protein YunB [Natronospora cellulosivora (SeqCode)]